MLDGIRKASKNWLGRAVLTVIMGILVLSFAVWGIGDMLRVTGTTYVARVGKSEISAEQYRTAYNASLEDVSQRLRRRLTNEEARIFGLDRQVLSRLITDAALDQKTRAMGLNLSDEEVVRQVMAEPSLKTANGQFDRLRFAEVLRQSGLNEVGFFAEQKRVMMRRELTAAVATDVPAPLALVEASYRYSAEQRVVSYFLLEPVKAGDIPTPEETTLKAFYDANKSDFRAPEYRKVNVLAALPAELGIDLTVTEADLRRVYDRLAASGQLGAPEKREIMQIIYPTEAEAAAAAEKVKGGTSFEALLTERNIKPQDANLGLKTQREFADPNIAKAAFELAESAVGGPIKTGFGAAVIKLSKIEPGTQVPYDSAKTALEPQAQAEKLRSDPRVQARLDEIQKKIDEAKVQGKSLAEASQSVGLALRTIEAIEASGADKAGTKIVLPGGDETLKGIFQSDIGLDNEAIRPRDGGLVWFDIAGVEPARDRAYDEIKPQLLARWKADEVAKKLSALASEDVKKIDAGEDIAKLAADVQALIRSVTVNRTNGGEIGATAAAQAFAVPVGRAATASLADGRRIVMKVVESKLEAFDATSGVGIQMAKQLSTQKGEDVLAQYVQKLQSELGTTINQKALQQAAGGGS